VGVSGAKGATGPRLGGGRLWRPGAWLELPGTGLCPVASRNGVIRGAIVGRSNRRGVSNTSIRVRAGSPASGWMTAGMLGAACRRGASETAAEAAARITGSETAAVALPLVFRAPCFPFLLAGGPMASLRNITIGYSAGINCFRQPAPK
jgi:hypothetical protein